MRKSDGGYVLLYVLAVLVVLALLALTVSSIALSNLRGQRAAVGNMQDRYAAEGVMEQAVARLQDSGTGPCSLSGSGFSSRTAAENALKGACTDLIGAMSESAGDPDGGIRGLSVSVTEIAQAEDEQTGAPTFTFTTQAETEAEDQQLNATLLVTLSVEIDSYLVTVGTPDPETGVSPTEERFRYKVNSVSLSYDSYQIQTLEPEGGGV